ncbi:transposase [Variovorax boronicumulans]|nr:transposase [Variovorax boronicumulans]
MKLCASHAFWLVAYPSQGHEMLFDAHTGSFAALGGVARRGIYDNMRTAVDKVHKGKGRTVNARFAVMCAHYLYDPDFCNVASGWEKGRVERTCRTAVGASGLRRPGAASAFRRTQRLIGRALPGAVERGPPSRTQSARPRCSSTNAPHLVPMPEPF